MSSADPRAAGRAGQVKACTRIASFFAPTTHDFRFPARKLGRDPVVRHRHPNPGTFAPSPPASKRAFHQGKSPLISRCVRRICAAIGILGSCRLATAIPCRGRARGLDGNPAPPPVGRDEAVPDLSGYLIGLAVCLSTGTILHRLLRVHCNQNRINAVAKCTRTMTDKEFQRSHDNSTPFRLCE